MAAEAPMTKAAARTWIIFPITAFCNGGTAPENGSSGANGVGLYADSRRREPTCDKRRFVAALRQLNAQTKIVQRGDNRLDSDGVHAAGLGAFRGRAPAAAHPFDLAPEEDALIAAG